MAAHSIRVMLRKLNDYCFVRHPLATNVTISCALTAVSDCVAQKLLQGKPTLDTQRTRHLVTYTFTIAPLWHGWYILLDYYVKSSKVWLKVVIDQTTVTPLDYFAFFAVFNYARGDSIQDCISELKRVYFKAFIPDTVFWPTATFVGYKYLPLRYRYLYFEFLQLGWGTFLSYLKYSGPEETTGKLEENELK